MIIMEVILWKFLSKVMIKRFGGMDYNKFLAESRRGVTGKDNAGGMVCGFGLRSFSRRFGRRSGGHVEYVMGIKRHLK